MKVIGSGGTIVQETRQYDGEAGASAAMRSKEMAHDYRYFPDPDLMPVKVDEAWLAAIRATLPERLFDRQRRYFEKFQLPYTLTSVLVPHPELCAFFEEAARLGGKPIVPAKSYRVAVNNFMATGGDGFATLIGGLNQQGGAQDIDALSAYLAGFNATAVPAKARQCGWCRPCRWLPAWRRRRPCRPRS